LDKVKILEKYLPKEAAPIVAKWIDYFKCEFKVSKGRNTKLGDYRPPHAGKGHRISVNYNLNPYAFLVTTVHEFAHLHTWNEYERKAKPHGEEWKDNFKKMMRPFFEKKIFPQEVKEAILNYLLNPAASSCADLNLFRTLKQYDKKVEGLTAVESVPAKAVFAFRNRIFCKDILVKKRYRCVELKTGKVYLFSPVAEVKIIMKHEAPASQ
jgi:hypothetical protein